MEAEVEVEEAREVLQEMEEALRAFIYFDNTFLNLNANYFYLLLRE